MTCPNCNSQYNDNLASCPFCSAQQAPVAPQQAPQQAPFQVPQGTQFTAPPAPVKKKKAAKIIPIIFFVFFAIVAIIGIVAENKEQTHTFVFEEDYYGYTISHEYEVIHKSDTVTKLVYTIVTEFDEGTDESIIEEEFEIYLENQQDTYEDYDFVTYEAEVDGLVITEKIVINDASDNVSGLVELEFMDEQGDSVSYEKTKENLEDEGFELVED